MGQLLNNCDRLITENLISQGINQLIGRYSGKSFLESLKELWQAIIHPHSHMDKVWDAQLLDNIKNLKAELAANPNLIGDEKIDSVMYKIFKSTTGTDTPNRNNSVAMFMNFLEDPKNSPEEILKMIKNQSLFDTIFNEFPSNIKLKLIQHLDTILSWLAIETGVYHGVDKLLDKTNTPMNIPTPPVESQDHTLLAGTIAAAPLFAAGAYGLYKHLKSRKS